MKCKQGCGRNAKVSKPNFFALLFFAKECTYLDDAFNGMCLECWMEERTNARMEMLNVQYIGGDMFVRRPHVDVEKPHEVTHSCCNERLEKEGGEAKCCACEGCEYCK